MYVEKGVPNWPRKGITGDEIIRLSWLCSASPLKSRGVLLTADDIIRLSWLCMAPPLKSRGALLKSRGVLLTADDIIRLSWLCMAPPLRSRGVLPASASGPSKARSITVEVQIHQPLFMVTSRLTESLSPAWRIAG